jgi:hypothetical protein
MGRRDELGPGVDHRCGCDGGMRRAGAVVAPGWSSSEPPPPLRLCLVYGMRGGDVHRCESGSPRWWRCDATSSAGGGAVTWG